MKFTFTKTFRHSFLAASTFASVVAIAPAATDAAERAECSERRWETRYLTALIDDHTLALQLAELAQTQATHEELKQLGAQTETALTAELTQLNSWLALSVAAHADDVAQLRLWLEQWYGEGADEADDGTDGTDETNGTNGISTGIDVGVGGDGASRGGLSDRVRGLSSRIGG